MENRDFFCYLTPVEGGADREIKVCAMNFGEAEALVAKHIGENEFISRIEQEFPQKDLTGR